MVREKVVRGPLVWSAGVFSACDNAATNEPIGQLANEPYCTAGNQRSGTFDDEAPGIIWTQPAHLAADVSVSTPSSLQFTEDMDPESIELVLDPPVDLAAPVWEAKSLAVFAPLGMSADGVLREAYLSFDLTALPADIVQIPEAVDDGHFSARMAAGGRDQSLPVQDRDRTIDGRSRWTRPRCVFPKLDRGPRREAQADGEGLASLNDCHRFGPGKGSESWASRTRRRGGDR